MATKKTAPTKAPVRFSPELAERICNGLISGMSLRAVCAQPNMPVESAVRLWVADDVQGFAAQYTRARAIGYESLADDLIGISDELEVEAKHHGEDVTLDVSSTSVARNRLRVDTRKWMLSKMLPKVYGDKQQVELSGSVDIASAMLAARKRAGKA